MFQFPAAMSVVADALIIVATITLYSDFLNVNALHNIPLSITTTILLLLAGYYCDVVLIILEFYNFILCFYYRSTNFIINSIIMDIL
jgi:hypothetical protein